MTETLPEGHPLTWDQLVPYEKDQGGYWLHPRGGDVYGNDKIWVRVQNPEHLVEHQGELDRYRNQVRTLTQRIAARAGETGNEQMAALAEALASAVARVG
ncbi:hypothetical protein [Streptomyces sp. NPDC005407]|uniref:hypothetical protein n=1 Tax=Streptomyces sp. NPDC005407 TaxID=3155340 RepID=UPI00339F58F5